MLKGIGVHLKGPSNDQGDKALFDSVVKKMKHVRIEERSPIFLPNAAIEPSLVAEPNPPPNDIHVLARPTTPEPSPALPTTKYRCSENILMRTNC